MSFREATRNLYGKRFLVPCAGLEMTISLFKQKTLKNIRALRLVVPDETGNGDFLVLRAERQIITPVAQRDALQDDFLPIQ